MAKKKKQVAKKKKQAEFPFIIDNITFSQEKNCCSDEDYERERLDVEFHNGGGGYFYVFKTSQFAFDQENDEHIKLIEKIKKICESNDILDEKEYRDYVRRENTREALGRGASTTSTPTVDEVPFDQTIPNKDLPPKQNENITCIKLNT